MKPEAQHQASPGGNKKKIRTQKQRTKTTKEKKERIWGKTPQKPYISSSIGDMTRVMMRYACMENTYFYNTEPPPVEFYNYWQRFSVEQSKLPSEFVDRKKASIANIKPNTSSFDFFGTYTHPIRSRQDLEEAGQGRKPKRRVPTAENQVDLWQDVRISMSSESFISSSTKISESETAVDLEVGWDDTCSEDYQSSESDFGLDVQDKNRHHRHRQHYLWALGLDSHGHHLDAKRKSSLEFHTPQGLIDKQTNAIQQALLALQKKDNRIIYELATQPQDSDIIDHFADDIDDSFLLDSYSYSDLPDNSFGPNFDFLNEDVIHMKKGKKGRGKKRKGKKSTKGPDDSDEDDNGLGVTTSATGVDSCADSGDENCQKNKLSKRNKKLSQAKSGKERDGDESTMHGEGYGYEACLERRRRKIEEVLKAAVRCRSPMGSFRPKKGEEPLSRYKEQNSPGPAAYTPQVTATKPSLHTAFLVPRWTKNIYETPGPGPATYVSTPKCTCEMLTLHETPRFTEDETIGPGPANVNIAEYHGTGKGKPSALIISRKNKGKPANDAQFKDIYGWTRFGKANPPKTLILGRNDPPEKGGPGPGAYDPNDCNNKKIDITIKSRIPVTDNENKPGYLNLPDLIGTSPGAAIGIRDFMKRKDQSPGPIYQLYPSKPNGISLTFRPFQMRGRETEPSPIEWGIGPGDGKNKTLPRAPQHYLVGKWKELGERHQIPGPNAYDICHECEECTEPGATLLGRYPIKTEKGPGPGAYDPMPMFWRTPMTVFQHKKEEKKIIDNRRYGDGPPKDNIVGGVMTPRWRSKESEKGGAELRNIFGFTNRGKKSRIPISLKSRHTPFKYAHIPDAKMVAYDNSACRIKS